MKAMSQRIAGALLLLASTLGASPAMAQAVYKCKAEGKTVYSHEPCLGAEVVDTTPTQGLDKSSGKSRKGADVRQSENDKLWADTFRPVLRETQADVETRRRRLKLLPEEKLECSYLDAKLPMQEASARAAAKDAAVQAQTVLLESRRRFRELRC